MGSGVGVTSWLTAAAPWMQWLVKQAEADQAVAVAVGFVPCLGLVQFLQFFDFTLSFLFSKYWTISFCFHLVRYTYVARFDVTHKLEKF